jgi:anti-sigma B factor antagonist
VALQGGNDVWFQPDNFSTTVTTATKGSVTVELAGEFDLSTAGDLRESLATSDVLDAKRVLVDLSRVSFFDSTSIGLLVSACKRVRHNGGAFSVHCDSAVVFRVLEITGLVDFFEVTTSRPYGRPRGG